MRGTDRRSAGRGGSLRARTIPTGWAAQAGRPARPVQGALVLGFGVMQRHKLNPRQTPLELHTTYRHGALPRSRIGGAASSGNDSQIMRPAGSHLLLTIWSMSCWVGFYHNKMAQYYTVAKSTHNVKNKCLFRNMKKQMPLPDYPLACRIHRYARIACNPLIERGLPHRQA